MWKLHRIVLVLVCLVLSTNLLFNRRLTCSCYDRRSPELSNDLYHRIKRSQQSILNSTNIANNVSSTAISSRQESVENVSRSRQGCVENVSRSQQGSVENVSRSQQGSVENVSRSRQESVENVSRSRQKSVENVSWSRQGSVENASPTSATRASIREQSISKSVSFNRYRLKALSQRQSIGEDPMSDNTSDWHWARRGFRSQRIRLPRRVQILSTESTPHQINVTWIQPDSIPQRRNMSYIDYNSTLTRLGSDLKFHLALCPLGSTRTRPYLWPPLRKNCPTLFIVGARKGGSTSLLQYISGHPDFEGGCLKCRHVGETFYFTTNYETYTWGEYLSNFPPDVLMTGESSVDYLVNCNAVKRILMNCGGHTKIVMLLRNPIDRFVSNFLMRVRGPSSYGISPHLNESTPIHNVVHKEVREYIHRAAIPPTGNTASVRIAEVQRTWTLHKCRIRPGDSLISEGMYYAHLMFWLCNFPAESILIINSEEFFTDTTKIVKQLVQFMGLKDLSDEEYINITSIAHNKGNYEEVPPHQQLSQNDRILLQQVYKPFNEALMDLLHWKNMSWNR